MLLKLTGGHVATVFFRLDVAASCPHVVETSGENLVFTQFTLKGAVVERNAARRLQADFVETFLAVTQDPGFTVGEIVLQLAADGLVEPQQVGRRDAFAVGRISDEQARMQRFLKILDVALLNGDFLGETGCFYVSGGDGNGVHIEVVAVDVVVEGVLLGVVVVHLLKEFAVEIGPFLEGILRAENTWRDASGNQGGLNEEGAGAAHGVDEIAFSAPSGHQDDAGSQHFVERCLHLLLPVAATVQTLARRVERQSAVILRHVNVELQVGVLQADVRAVAGLLAHLVHDGVFHFVGHHLGVAELAGIDHAVDGKGGAVGEILCPIDSFHGVIHFVSRLGTEMFDGLEDADGGAQLDIGAVHHLQVAGEGHHAATDFDVVGSEPGEFFGQNVLQSLERFGDHFKLHMSVIFFAFEFKTVITNLPSLRAGSCGSCASWPAGVSRPASCLPSPRCYRR